MNRIHGEKPLLMNWNLRSRVTRATEPLNDIQAMTILIGTTETLRGRIKKGKILRRLFPHPYGDVTRSEQISRKTCQVRPDAPTSGALCTASASVALLALEKQFRCPVGIWNRSCHSNSRMLCQEHGDWKVTHSRAHNAPLMVRTRARKQKFYDENMSTTGDDGACRDNSLIGFHARL